MTAVFVVFAIIAGAVLLFVLEVFPVEVTALVVMVTLILLEPWTQISPAEGISGFSNPATITVLAMLILSEGVRRTGLVQILSDWAARMGGRDVRRQLATTFAISGPISGFVNNTPVVALMVPVVSDMGHKGNTSPSKLLIPLSFVSMMGGMLTLVGTSTNLLASNLSERLLDHPISMFEFTHLGALVLVIGAAYLLVFAPRLLPARVKPRADINRRGGEFLTEIEILERAELIGEPLSELLELGDLEVARRLRGTRTTSDPSPDSAIEKGDIYMVQTGRDTLERLRDLDGVVVAPGFGHGTFQDEEDHGDLILAEVVVPPSSPLVDARIKEFPLGEGAHCAVLAIRQRGEDIRRGLEKIRLRSGDMLLIEGTRNTIDYLARDLDLLLLRRERDSAQRRSKIPLAIGILVGVVGFAALGVFPILVTSLAGAVAMLVTGILRPTEIYHSMRWQVFFLLGGVIPLGMALEQTGGAGYLADAIATSGEVLPAIVVLWLFYIVTGLITEVISNNASVVLMIPVAIETASRIDANPFAFVLAVAFAASTTFLGPVGYQTNLFVYGPGGYKVSDFARVGAPLQLLLSIVTVCGIATLWGL